MSVITAGFSITESLLITKGYGGVIEVVEKPSVIGGGKVVIIPRVKRTVKPFVFTINVVGKKFNLFSLYYNLSGKKIIYIDNRFVLLGIKQTSFELSYLTNAILKRYLSLDKSLIGNRFTTTQKIVELSGSKYYELETCLISQGIKSSEISYIRSLISQRSFIFSNINKLQGMKSFNLITDNQVIGKRDITPILYSLDILE